MGGRKKRQIERVIDSGTTETEVFMPFCGATLISEQVEKSTRILFSILLAIKLTIYSPPVAGHCCPLCACQSTGGRLLSAHFSHCWGLQVVLGSNRLTFKCTISALRQNCPPGCHRILPEQLQVLYPASIGNLIDPYDLSGKSSLCLWRCALCTFFWKLPRCTSVWQMWPSWS